MIKNEKKQRIRRKMFMQKRRMLTVCSVCLVLLFSLASGALAANANFGKTAAVYRTAATEALQMNG